MKTLAMDKGTYEKNQSDDDNVRYKINTKYTPTKSPKTQKIDVIKNEDTEVRYKLPPILIKNKHVEQKPKTKPKIKVNFWSSKQSSSRLHNTEVNQPIKVKAKSNCRHTVAVTSQDSKEIKPKQPTVKVSKRVSFLPSPLFSDNHAPMVTVPDDLTINLNEEEAKSLGGDFNLGLINNDSDTGNKSNNELKSKSKTSFSPKKGIKRKCNSDLVESNPNSNQNELEFFSKYVVQKLRKMDTNQRIYSENLINTTLMLGQLGKLNGKSKIAET